MNCCSECFSSSYLKIIVNSTVSVGNCDFCKTTNVSVYEPKELALIFQKIFDLYQVVEEGGSTIEKQIISDFNDKIFSQKVEKNVKKLLKEIITFDYKEYKKFFTKNVVLNYLTGDDNENKLKPLEISWERFAKEIKSTNRFFIQNALDLEILSDLLVRYEKEYKRGKLFFRARISENKDGFKIVDMKNPPPQKATAGRANPLGISYLYISNDVKTTLYEARASLFDFVTAGTLRLKEDVKVINLRGDTYDPILLSEKGLLEDFLIHLPFITKLEQELSKPRRRSDNELDYLPTQYLSEFIKSIGFDGVEFQSSLYPQGYNLAIFNAAKFECIKVEVFDIEKIDLTHKLIP